MSVRSFLKISVTTEPFGFSSSGRIPTGPVVVLAYLLGVGGGGGGHPKTPQKNKKSSPNFFRQFKSCGRSTKVTLFLL